MNKLFIYGCSHSMKFENFRINAFVDKPWGEILGEKLKYQPKIYAAPGASWDGISQSLLQTFGEWNKEKDIILVSPSILSRKNFLEIGFTVNGYEYFTKYLKDVRDLKRDRINSIHKTISNFKKLNYNILIWFWDLPKDIEIEFEVELKELLTVTIPPPIPYDSFELWNKDTPEFWLGYNTPYKKNGIKHNNDTHLNDNGHNFIADYFYSYLKERL